MPARTNRFQTCHPGRIKIRFRSTEDGKAAGQAAKTLEARRFMLFREGHYKEYIASGKASAWYFMGLFVWKCILNQYFYSPPCAPTLPENSHHPLTLHIRQSDFFALHKAHSPPSMPFGSKEIQMRRFNSIEAAESWLDAEESFKDEFDQIVHSMKDGLHLTPPQTAPLSPVSPVSSNEMPKLPESDCFSESEAVETKGPRRKSPVRRPSTPPPYRPSAYHTIVQVPPSPPPSPRGHTRRASDPSYASLPSSIYTSLDSNSPASTLSHADLLEGMLFSLRRRARSESLKELTIVTRRKGIFGWVDGRRSTGTIGITLSTGRVGKVSGTGRKWSASEQEKRKFFDWGLRKARGGRIGNSGKRVVDIEELDTKVRETLLRESKIVEQKANVTVENVGGDGMDIDMVL